MLTTKDSHQADSWEVGGPSPPQKIPIEPIHGRYGGLGPSKGFTRSRKGIPVHRHALCERARARTTAEQFMGAWGRFLVRSVARVHCVVPLRASRPRSRGACHVKPPEELGPPQKTPTEPWCRQTVQSVQPKWK